MKKIKALTTGFVFYSIILSAQLDTGLPISDSLFEASQSQRMLSLLETAFLGEDSASYVACSALSDWAEQDSAILFAILDSLNSSNSTHSSGAKKFIRSCSSKKNADILFQHLSECPVEQLGYVLYFLSKTWIARPSMNSWKQTNMHYQPSFGKVYLQRLTKHTSAWLWTPTLLLCKGFARPTEW